MLNLHAMDVVKPASSVAVLLNPHALAMRCSETHMRVRCSVVKPTRDAYVAMTNVAMIYVANRKNAELSL